MLKAALLGKMPNQVELDDTEKDVDQVPAKTPPTPPGRATR
jgi:hypothetical protein